MFSTPPTFRKMRITIQNFKCYLAPQTFTFNKCSLLQGASGLGKSTIIQAIVWCLYGGNRRYYGNKGGKESAQTYVTIEFPEYNGLVIRRTPKTIEVSTPTYLQGTEAEAYITSVFGSQTLFKASSYIAQNSRCTLVNASASEKAEILHKLTFGEQSVNVFEDPQSYIGQIQTKLKVYADEIIRQRILYQELSTRYKLTYQNYAPQIELWSKRFPATLTLKEIDTYLIQVEKLLTENAEQRDIRYKYEFQLSEATKELSDLKLKLLPPKGDIHELKSQLDKVNQVLLERKSQDDLVNEYTSLSNSLEGMMDLLSLSKEELQAKTTLVEDQLTQYAKGFELATRYRFPYTPEGLSTYQNTLTAEISEIVKYPTLLKEWEQTVKTLTNECEQANAQTQIQWKAEFDRIYTEEMQYTKEISSITSENNRLIELHNEYKRAHTSLTPLMYIFEMSELHRLQRLALLKDKLSQSTTNKSIIFKYDVKDLNSHISNLNAQKEYHLTYDTVYQEWQKSTATLKEQFEHNKQQWIKECDLIRDENSHSEQARIVIEGENRTKQAMYNNYISKVNEQNRLKQNYQAQIEMYKFNFKEYTNKLEVATQEIKTTQDTLAQMTKSFENEVLWIGSIPSITDLQLLRQQILIAKNQLKCPSCSTSLQLKNGTTLIKFDTSVSEGEMSFDIQLSKIEDALTQLKNLHLYEKAITILQSNLAKLVEPQAPIEQTFEQYPEVTLDLQPIPPEVKKILPREPIMPPLDPQPEKPSKNLQTIEEELSQVLKITSLNNPTLAEEKEHDDILKFTEYEPLYTRFVELKEHAQLHLLSLPESKSFIKCIQPTNKQPLLPPVPTKPNRSLTDVLAEGEAIKGVLFPPTSLDELKSQNDRFKRIPDCINNWTRVCELKPIVGNFSEGNFSTDTSTLKVQAETLSKSIDEYKQMEYAFVEHSKQITHVEDRLKSLSPGCTQTLEQLNKSKLVYEDAKKQSLALKNACVEYDRVTHEYNQAMHAEQTLKYFVDKEANLSQVLGLVKELESQAVEDVVTAINNEANKILEFIFENEIRVELRTHYEYKSRDGSKLQINIQVSYHDCDDLGILDLSGGEQDRISMALTLAMAKISNSPFILLDECLSSLDNNIRTKCIKVLKFNFAEKTVINVCHEMINGLFDNIVDLTPDS